ncbi:MAG: LON peptidase substrate-binding domain-containing protein, partial [Desulfonatronovibrio sp.]
MSEDIKKTAPQDDEQKKQPENISSKDTGESELDIPSTLPLLPVRDIVVFNYMILPLFVGRDKSVQAIDSALNKNRYMLISAQKDEQVENPGPDDVYKVGTVGLIMRMLKMPDGRLKVLVQGIGKAKIKKFVQNEPFDVVEVEMLKDR